MTLPSWEGQGEGEIPIVKAVDVDAAVDQAIEQGANALQWIWNGLPPAERIVMAAMAQATSEQISQDELTDILNRSKVRLILRDLELAPETLIRWDLLRPADGGFRFAIPLLRYWVRREKPLRRVKADLDNVEPLAENLYRSGEGFYKLGNLNDAEQQLRRALNINPNHFRARLLLGQVLIGQGNPTAAVTELEPAYQFDPRSARAGLIAGLLALAGTQNEDEQLTTYDRILVVDPEQRAAFEKRQAILRHRAETALNANDLTTALKLYQELGDQENVSRVQTLLRKRELETQLAGAQKYEETDDWTAAIAIYEKLLQEFPAEGDWQARLKVAQAQKTLAETYTQAMAALEKGNPALAQKLFGEIIAIQPNYKDTALYLLLAVKGINADDLSQKLRQAAARIKKAYQQIEDLGSGVILEMVCIPGGTFLMGSPETEEGRSNDEGPQHAITIAPFYIGKYPITQEQWETVMGSNPSYFKGAKQPVEQVSWDDAVEFCKWLSEKTGHTYRLPTEAEWEYACRAGTTTPFYFGETITPELANYDGRYNGTTEVGKFPPNAFRLYDMHGNVWEWCQDWYSGNYYAQSPEENPPGPTSGSYRVIRGGSWNLVARYCRAADRIPNSPDHRNDGVGFRLVRTPS